VNTIQLRRLGALAAVGALGAAAATVPALAKSAAKPGAFRGSIETVGASGTQVVVNVTGGSEGGKSYVGRMVSFNITTAKLVANDNNHDGSIDVLDIRQGDLVTVFVAATHRPQPLRATKLQDRTKRGGSATGPAGPTPTATTPTTPTAPGGKPHGPTP
jgi:hypothetical protein